MKIDEMEHEEEDILEDSEQSLNSFDDRFSDTWDGRWEYAFESLTERRTAFRRREPTY